jgi:hypothetical protein
VQRRNNYFNKSCPIYQKYPVLLVELKITQGGYHEKETHFTITRHAALHIQHTRSSGVAEGASTRASMNVSANINSSGRISGVGTSTYKKNRHGHTLSPIWQFMDLRDIRI